MVGLNDLRGLFQPSRFYDSMVLWVEESISQNVRHELPRKVIWEAEHQHHLEFPPKCTDNARDAIGISGSLGVCLWTPIKKCTTSDSLVAFGMGSFCRSLGCMS